MATAKLGPVTVAPLRVQPAYADREAVRRTILEHAPYPMMIAGAGYSEMMQSAPLEPWFRTTWAADADPRDESIHALIHDPRFIEGAGNLFGAKVIRPQRLVVNVMGPMAAGYRHVDLPTYRGISPEIPLWFPMVMGVSGLFERWAVRVAGALTWFYDGTDGEYEYWPRGIDQPSESERGPFGNVALFGDNDLMFHQIGAIGDAARFKDQVKLTVRSEIRPVQDGWEITDGGSVVGKLPDEQVRISLLWRAITFRDEREAHAYDQHEDDLDVDTAIARFCDDLTERGIAFTPPEDPFNDPAWSSLLTQTYLASAFV
ncbi:hypothetical protein [Mycobacterium conspicuum]|uniref:Uncharacterized protein n=1 Tax=Mycobacterium conspicuum TaxID=44010 RepID=A0A7I7Y823_9MYCO|nr:hypothetical protein [Mycobacterium conspicuum]BBZ37868.1 hypothetical protein MCNS_09310 [Mycobacterium conspicuum]